MHQVSVSVVYATTEQQWLYETTVSKGTSARELVVFSRFLDDIPALQTINVEQLQVGIYAEKVPLDYLLKDGDRVEIYRPLTADPKEVRRQLALMGKVIGKKGKKVK